MRSQRRVHQRPARHRLAVLAAAVVAGLSLVAASASAAVQPPSSSTVAGPFRVVDIVDGDTVRLRIDTTLVTVRLIGIDTPETVDPRRPVQCFGPQASRRAHDLLDGTSVFVEVDPSQGQRDRYGRTLAYLWLPDGRMFNEVMVRDGFAREYTYRTAYTYQHAFRTAETTARQQQRGLWGACGTNRATSH